MSVCSGEYVRVYLTVVDDDRFAGIYDDDHHWATYTRLLMLADIAWPASASLPRSARRASVAALVTAGIVELGASDRFRIHGLDPERQRRSDHARSAAEYRWGTAPGNAASTAPGNAQSMLAKQSLAEHSKAEQTAGEADPIAEALFGAYGGNPSSAVMKWGDRLGDQYGAEAAARSIGASLLDGRDGLMGRAEGALKLAARRAERTEREEELASLREKHKPGAEYHPAPTQMTDEEIQADIARYRAEVNANA